MHFPGKISPGPPVRGKSRTTHVQMSLCSSIQSSGSPLGVVLAMSADILVDTTGRTFFWPLEGRDQRCCQTSHGARGIPHGREWLGRSVCSAGAEKPCARAIAPGRSPSPASSLRASAHCLPEPRFPISSSGMIGTPVPCGHVGL